MSVLLFNLLIMVNLTNWYKRIGQRIVASSLVSTVLSLSMLAGPAYAVRLPGGFVDTNPDVEEGTSLKDALKDVKKFLIEREPPFEPFFFRAAWGSAELGGELKWDVNVSVNEGRLFVRKLLDAETGDTATRGSARFARGLNQMDVKTVTGVEGEKTGYDGVMGIYRKPIGVDKDEIEFTFTAGGFKVTKTMEELQMDTFRSDEVTMGEKTGQTVYLDVINYDTKRGQFGKGRMELIFLNWGNVANLDMSVDTLAEAVDVTRNYVVTIGLENAEDTKLNYLATLGMEEDVEDFQIDNVLISDNTQQVTVSSTISGGTDVTDGIVLALQGTFDAQEIPFMQRGVTVRVAEVAGYNNFPEMEEIELPGDEEEEVETAETVQVTMRPTAFLPKDVTVSVGDTVKWTNTDSSPHTVTFDDLNKSGNLDPGATFERTFTAAGTYAYVCDYHQASGMVGAVTVTEAVSSVLLAQEAGEAGDDVSDDTDDDAADEDSADEDTEDEDTPGDADGDGVLDDSDVVIDEVVVIKDIIDDTGQKDLELDKEVFAKTFMTTEEFGMYDFDDKSGYALRIMNGSFLWNNTPAVLKALLIIKSLQSLLFYLKWVATPAQLIALGGVGLVTAAYMAQVQEALFGETTISEEGLDELQAQVDKQVAQLKAQIMLAYDEDAISDVDTEKEAEEFADSDELDEALEDIEQAGEDFEDDYNEELADDGQQCYEEDICDFSDVPQAMVQGGTVVPTWFKDYVRLAVERGLVSGFKDASGKPTGAFHPGENVLMAQVLKVSLLANDIEFAYNESASYPEAGCEGAWYCTYVAACEATFQDSPFCDIARELPNFPANRAEVAGFMVGLGGVAANVDCNAEGVRCFPDSSYEKTYQTAGTMQYQAYIEHLHQAGCVSGVGETGMYVPPDLINRAAFAKIANCVAALSGVDPE